MCQLYFGFECAINEALKNADILGPLVVLAIVAGAAAPPALAVLAAGYRLTRGS